LEYLSFIGLLIGNIALGFGLAASLRLTSIFLIMYILRGLLYIFNEEAINKDSFENLADKLDDNGLLYFGIPIILASVYIWVEIFRSL
tara:strand:- start:79 stop:342 length:264 start_codon:yes stop_codon:yes gene_type:complete